MDLSVVIINWNSGRCLLECLSSFYKNNKSLNSEVFVIDNASSDDSLACLKKFRKVRLIKTEKNLGFSRANNYALKKAKGRYVLLLNPDTVVLKDSLIGMISFLDRYKEVGVLGCKLLNHDGSVQPSCHAFLTTLHVFFEVSQINLLFPKNRFFVKLFSPLRKLFPNMLVNYSIPNKPVEVDSVMGSCYMIRREALKKTGLLDEKFFLYHEEMELSYRMWQNGFKVMFYPQASILHYGRYSTEQVSDLVYYERCRSILHFFRKHKSNRLAILKIVMFFSLLINFLSLPFKKNFKNALNYKLRVLKLLK